MRSPEMGQPIFNQVLFKLFWPCRATFLRLKGSQCRGTTHTHIQIYS